MPNTITIHLLYFAMFREHIGASSEQLVVPTGTTAGDVFSLITERYPVLESMRNSTLVMVNEAYTEADQVLEDGDEVALIPPVSGGDPHFVCTEEVLDPRAIEALVAGDDAGALVTFIGSVRNHARGREVVSLEYEAYPPAATKMLAQVGAEVEEQWPAVRIAIAHRFGHLYPGDASVVIACSSDHRDDAYAASSWAISQIKEIVPIWKKEHYTDGASWIGSEHTYQVETGRIVEE
ncbi:MAG: molybdopterin converting factor subunit 1 [Thermomicrobiales bacterium]|nr:molybdopterin converting factor subunit 1 [Thermomicrobiales bacterium]MCO5226265.1 molybdopterin converting factor subunit 1 [Thermomicrobiales bacterium]MCO5228439.1 molybdopterin converting factor subunit 1 [Thermomicrobiales bacterium]